MKKNPLACYRNDLFGSRGVDVGAALTYVNELASASSDGVAVQTAAYVLLNTVLGAMDQVLNAPSVERLALIDLIDQRIDEHKLIREDEVDGKISSWIDDNLDVDDQISNWMSDNFDVSDYNVEDVVDDKIKEWASDNLADEVSESIKQLTFRVTVD
jgi:hypothetical protein